MKALAMAANDLRRLVRWRANVFFLFVLPMMIILLLGAAFGGAQKARIGLVAHDRGPLAQQLVGALAHQPSTHLIRYSADRALERAVSRGEVDAGLVVPAGYDLGVRQSTGATVDYLGRPNSAAQQLRSTAQAVIADQSRMLAAAQAVQRGLHVPFAAALVRVKATAAHIRGIDVALTDPNGSAYTATAGRFEQGASTELVLFIFLTSMTGAAFLIETRRLGIARRVLSTPTSIGTIIAGQVLGRLAVALVQASIIVLGTMLFFGVSWGDPLGTAAVILAFCLVGTGVAVLVGSLCATEQQAQPIAFLLGLGLAALGGSMAPLEVFPSTARTIAHITPHAWANDAFTKLLKHGGDLVTVLPQVAVLLGFAALATVLAIGRLRRALTA